MGSPPPKHLDPKTIRKVLDELPDLRPEQRNQLPDLVVEFGQQWWGNIDTRQSGAQIPYLEDATVRATMGNSSPSDSIAEDGAIESNKELDRPGESVTLDEVESAIRRLHQFQVGDGDAAIDCLRVFLAFGRDFVFGLEDFSIPFLFTDKLGTEISDINYDGLISTMVLAGVINTKHVDGAPFNQYGRPNFIFLVSPHIRLCLTDLGIQVINRCEDGA